MFEVILLLIAFASTDPRLNHGLSLQSWRHEVLGRNTQQYSFILSHNISQKANMKYRVCLMFPWAVTVPWTMGGTPMGTQTPHLLVARIPFRRTTKTCHRQHLLMTLGRRARRVILNHLTFLGGGVHLGGEVQGRLPLTSLLLPGGTVRQGGKQATTTKKYRQIVVELRAVRGDLRKASLSPLMRIKTRGGKNHPYLQRYRKSIGI